MRILLQLLVCVSLALPAQGQLCKPVIDSLFYSRLGLKNVPGLGVSIAVIHGDSTFYYAFGNRDHEQSQPIDSNTVFEIGSNTKLFTALLLACDLQRNSIRRDAPIDTYLPGKWTLCNGIKQKVKLTDLASFSSGLPAIHEDAYDSILFSKDSMQPYAAVSRDYLGTVLSQTDSLTGYGQYQYSNFNYALLGAILEKWHRRSYETLLYKHILKPLKMSHTITGYRRPENAAGGYDERGRAVDYTRMAAMAPAGVLKSNACDMARFIRAQLYPGNSPLGQAIVITQETFLHNDNLRIGLGWHIFNDEYVMFGDTIGNSSAIGFSPRKKIGIVVLMNEQDSDLRQNIFNYLYDKVADLVN